MSGDSIKKIVGSGTILLAESFLRMGMMAAISFWIARKIGPAEFGIINAASALTAIFIAMAAMGMDTPLILRLAKEKNHGEIIGAALLIRTAVGTLFFFIACVVIVELKNSAGSERNINLIIGLSIVFNIPSVFDYWFRSQNNVILPASSRLISTIVATGAKSYFLIVEADFFMLAWAIALEALIVNFMTSVFFLRSFRKIDCHIVFSGNKLVFSMVRESFPYMLSTVAVMAYMKIDVVMLAQLSTNEQTGVYSLAQKLSEVIYIVPVVVMDVMFPSFVGKNIADKENYPRHEQRFFDLAMASATVVTVAAVFLAPVVIVGLFGEKYLQSAEVFQVHAWSCIAITLNTARHRWFAVCGLQRLAPFVTAIGLVINVLLNWFWIPMYGAYGAALATVVSYMFSGHIISYFIPSLRGLASIQTRSFWPWQRLYTDFLSWKFKRSHS